MNSIDQENAWEGYGRCRKCGGPKDYPMLVRLLPNLGSNCPQTVCRAVYHTVRYRVASFIFKKLSGFEPPQKQ